MRRFLLHTFNLLVGCPREREHAAESEVRYFIGGLLGDSKLRISTTPISGLLACWTSFDPFFVIRNLRKIALENPYQFRFAIRFTPLERCVPSELAALADAAKGLLHKIGPNETFRVTVRRRHTELDHMQVVDVVADVIPRQVNLDNPDKTVWIEIVGDWSGVSVLAEDDEILSIRSMYDD